MYVQFLKLDEHNGLKMEKIGMDEKWRFVVRNEICDAQEQKSWEPTM